MKKYNRSLYSEEHLDIKAEWDEDPDSKDIKNLIWCPEKHQKFKIQMMREFKDLYCDMMEKFFDCESYDYLKRNKIEPKTQIAGLHGLFFKQCHCIANDVINKLYLCDIPWDVVKELKLHIMDFVWVNVICGRELPEFTVYKHKQPDKANFVYPDNW